MIQHDGRDLEITDVIIRQKGAHVLFGQPVFTFEVMSQADRQYITGMFGPGRPVLVLDRRDPSLSAAPAPWCVIAWLNAAPFRTEEQNPADYDGSHLLLMWYQEPDFSRPIESLLLDALKDVEWERHASNFCI